MGKFAWIFLIVGIIGFRLVANDFFPNGGLPRILAAGIVGAVCGGVGAAIDKRGSS